VKARRIILDTYMHARTGMNQIPMHDTTLHISHEDQNDSRSDQVTPFHRLYTQTSDQNTKRQTNVLDISIQVR
jgi:hypothetical protein